MKKPQEYAGKMYTKTVKNDMCIGIGETSTEVDCRVYINPPSDIIPNKEPKLNFGSSKEIIQIDNERSFVQYESKANDCYAEQYIGYDAYEISSTSDENPVTISLGLWYKYHNADNLDKW